MTASTLSRRKFIRRSAVATISFPFVSSLTSAALAADEPRKLGFALVGLGGLSTGQLGPALQKTQHCRLAAIVTGTPSKIPVWQAKYNIPDKSVYNYDTMEHMADNPDIDVVYVVTPNALHAEHTIKAAKAGKHVLCEKPMEATTEKCQQMIDEVKKAGRMLAIGYRCQFEPNHLECRRLATEKVFGELKTIEGGFSRSITATEWRVKKALAGGGPLMDVGIYALQTCRFVSAQEPTEVTAKFGPVTDPDKFKEVEESVKWEMTFRSGLKTTCRTNYEKGDANEFTVTAEKGSFGLKPAYGYGGVRGTRSDGQDIHLNSLNQFAAEMDDFAQCILNKKPSKVSGEEGLRDVKIMMAIYESARTGKTVKLA
ncbi:MAG TPA: Gfo/Idh/MocA family oxidoreductase [Verrucomicrobiae bacterium]|nr:Gfo/Idh/MocA family oxidoreductase [Verrucomicrobiae bacterium]